MKVRIEELDSNLKVSSTRQSLVASHSADDTVLLAKSEMLQCMNLTVESKCWQE